MRPGDTGHVDRLVNHWAGQGVPAARVAHVTPVEFAAPAEGYLITVTDQPATHQIDDLLDELYFGLERVTQAEIYRRAVAAELPADLLARINAMPQGEYAIDEAAELLGGTTR